MGGENSSPLRLSGEVRQEHVDLSGGRAVSRQLNFGVPLHIRQHQLSDDVAVSKSGCRASSPAYAHFGGPGDVGKRAVFSIRPLNRHGELFRGRNAHSAFRGDGHGKRPVMLAYGQRRVTHRAGGGRNGHVFAEILVMPAIFRTEFKSHMFPLTPRRFQCRQAGCRSR